MERDGDPIRLAIEVDRDIEPLRGRVIGAGGLGHREFIGWTGLAAALTEILDDAATAGKQPSDYERRRP